MEIKKIFEYCYVKLKIHQIIFYFYTIQYGILKLKTKKRSRETFL